MRVEVWHCEGIDDGFLQFFDDGVETADIWGVLARCFDLHRLVLDVYFPRNVHAYHQT